jgi:putative DNA primase/helicase
VAEVYEGIDGEVLIAASARYGWLKRGIYTYGACAICGGERAYWKGHDQGLPVVLSMCGNHCACEMSESHARLVALLDEGLPLPEMPEPEDTYEELRERVAEAERAETFSDNGSGPLPPDGDPPKGWTVFLAETICADNHFALSEGGELHYYDRGRYRPGGKVQIKRLVKQALITCDREGLFTRYRANEVYAYIAADAGRLWPTPPPGKMSLLNGIIDYDTRELLPHTPVYLSTLQLPVKYDPAADCPAWLLRNSQWFPADAQQTPWELLAWAIRWDINLQKAALLIGDGENGKSRFLAGFKAFLGARNVAALSLQQIEKSRWATHHLYGKQANICSDLPSKHLETSSTFKAITGGDLTPAEVKHGELYEYRPHVRLIFSANQALESKDASRAFYRRWLVIPFEASFSAAERLPEAVIDGELAAPSELSGALNRALDAMPDVMRRGIAETPSMRRAHQEIRQVTDPLEVWLDANLIELPDAYTIKGDLLKAYNAAARAKGWNVLTDAQFGRRVKEWRPDISEGQRRVGDSRPTTWEGIGLKDG